MPDAPGSTGTSTMNDQMDKARSVITDQMKAIASLRERVAELENVDGPAATEPIAVVSMAMRFPGGIRDGEQYWSAIVDPTGARSLITEPPVDRPELTEIYGGEQVRPGASTVRHAAYMDDIGSFDNAFFGISSREAESMDPQQRLLLETSWHAFEGAGVRIDKTIGTRAGVYIGMMNSEYSERISYGAEMDGIDPYFSTGGGHCFTAGRISYALGLTGPAQTVDTACSSSLVALDNAVTALRAGKCDLALAGGTNLILSPELMVSLSQTGAVAPDGRCKSFLESADGYGRGEGVGVTLLMRLSDAIRERRPVRGVVLGTAVNHDGASSGLTVPNGPAQQKVIREALADAGVEAREVGYVEAHGTGTRLGDPIEIGAIDAVLGVGAGARPAPVSVGTVKSRMGHLEAAAGIAGFIKAVLAVEKGVVPPAVSPGDAVPNSLIDWEHINVALPGRASDWSRKYERRVAGVSAFGMSGTNAHVVVAGSPVEPAPETVDRGEAPPHLLTLSARTEESVRELAHEMAVVVTGTPEDQIADFAHTTRVGRTHFEHRLVAVGADRLELALRLRELASGQDVPPLETTHADVRATVEAFLERRPVDLALMSAPTARIHPGVPRYPFDGRRFWRMHPLQPVAQADGSADGGPSAAGTESDGMREQLVTGLRDILKEDELGVDDLFVEVGGDSFAAMMLMRRVRDEHGVDLDPAGLPLGGTVGQLVDHILGEIRSGVVEPVGSGTR